MEIFLAQEPSALSSDENLMFMAFRTLLQRFQPQLKPGRAFPVLGGNEGITGMANSICFSSARF